MGDATGDRFAGIETVLGSSYNDTLSGDANANELLGGAGNDTLAGGAGADHLAGGEGIDLLDYSTSAAGVTVDLLTGTALGGDAAGDVFSGFENLTGSKFDDLLTGSVDANAIARSWK